MPRKNTTERKAKGNIYRESLLYHSKVVHLCCQCWAVPLLLLLFSPARWYLFSNQELCVCVCLFVFSSLFSLFLRRLLFPIVRGLLCANSFFFPSISFWPSCLLLSFFTCWLEIWALFAYVRAIYDVVESRSIFYQPAMGGSTRGYEVLQTYSKIHDDSIAAAAAAVGSISFDLMLYTTHGHNNDGGERWYNNVHITMGAAAAAWL